MAPTGPTAIRVLIVDDESSVLAFVDRVLRGAEYIITLAASGREALEHTATSDPFHLLVADVIMPEMRGDELAGRLRQSQPDLPVLYLTGYSDMLLKEKTTLWRGLPRQAMLSTGALGGGLTAALWADRPPAKPAA
jgi:CheY-like chemotaxis protein